VQCSAVQCSGLGRRADGHNGSITHKGAENSGAVGRRSPQLTCRTQRSALFLKSALFPKSTAKFQGRTVDITVL
jgi:hypothetical protein